MTSGSSMFISGSLAYAPADLRSVHVRQAEIEDHEIGTLPLERIERLSPAARDRDRVAARPQKRGRCALDRNLVIDQQDLNWPRHRLSPSSAAASRLSTATAIVNTAPPSR
jgi:hypothetical protein